MNIFVFSSRFPYPIERGDKLRLYHQIKRLSEAHAIHLYTLADHSISPKDYQEVAQYCESITIEKLTTFKRVKNVLASFGKKLPFLVSSNYSNPFHRIIKRDILLKKPDLVFCQLIRMAEYVKDLNTPAYLDYMDAYGIGMERRVAISSIFYKPIYQLESNRTKIYEKAIYNQFAGHSVISKQDADLLAVGQVDIIPNGIDHHYFKPIPKEKKFDIGFIGNMGYLPNVDAALILAKDILPTYFILYSKTLSLLIAGARPHSKVQNLHSKHITISGWVEDIRFSYAECKILVAPLYNGTGQQNKILEAMSMGIPCITTDEVNKAIEATPGKHLLIANTKTEFAKAIHNLLHTKQLYNDISTQCRDFIVQTYGWDTSITKLNTTFERVKTIQKNKC